MANEADVKASEPKWSEEWLREHFYEPGRNPDNCSQYEFGLDEIPPGYKPPSGYFRFYGISEDGDVNPQG